MKLGIIGKPQCGKTTVFNAASGNQVAVGDFSQSTHRAVIKVPDERVDKLTELLSPQKVTYTEIEFLDAPGFTGKGKASTKLEINPELRNMDALIVVIDCYTPDADPVKDIQDLIDEMILSDQVMLENILEKKSRKMKLTGDKSGTQELAMLEKCLNALEGENLLIDLDFTSDEEKLLRAYMFLSMKPLLFVLNIGEDDISRSKDLLKESASFVTPGKREAAILCGKIEMELDTLDSEDRQLFMDDLGITTPAIEQVIKKSYALLKLISFFTVEGLEVRASAIKKGTIAQKAAGVIHSDIERGFIRAEVIKYEDYIEYKTTAAIKAAGKVRLEGKDYVVQDGDVILFRFNV